MRRKLLSLIMVGACAPAAVQPPESQEPPQPQLAEQVITQTAVSRPMHIVFSWTYTEENARFSGQGATRVEPPYRARLDLFGPRGETYLAAAAVGDTLRLPPNMASGLRSILPPIALLWSALGVVRGPEGATLRSTTQRGDTLVLGYARNDERWSFRSIAGRLQFAEWNGPNSGRRTVELRGTGRFDLPAVAVYRDWAAFRELTLTLEQANEAASFPADIWYPGQ